MSVVSSIETPATAAAITAASQTRTQVKVLTLSEIISNARAAAFKGGIAGASAQVINVFSLMWLRTTMNYQYRHGGNLPNTLKLLYADGGVPRFYRGLIPALIQSPMSRFGDTAANAGVLSLLDSKEATANLPVGVKTALCSVGAASFRLVLMPIDAWKTIKQVEGGAGLKALVTKVKTHGVSKLYHGSLAAFGATWVGHYPWFVTYNYLSVKLPPYEFPCGKYVRNASIGFTASVISDCISNSIRVLKTTKQTSTTPITYKHALTLVIEKDGVIGLMGRGLKTRILTNGLQGMAFTVAWRAISDALQKRNEKEN